MKSSVFAAAIAAVTSLTAQTPPYRVTHSYVLGGEGSWDYVVPDPPNHCLFVARQNRVMVIDQDKGTLLGEVAGIQGAHGTALAPDTGHGFATSGADQSVLMFDLKTFKVLGRIPAAEDADAILFDKASNRVFTLNGDAHSSTVIDPAAGKLITNIALGGKPEYGASTGDGKVYANLTDTSEVVEIDAAKATVTRRWSTAPCRQPVAMAVDTVHHRLFSGCRSGVMAVSDYRAGKVVATFANRRGSGRSRFRPGNGGRVCVQCGRHADGDSSGHAGPIPCVANARDASGVAEHGTRFNESQGLRGIREVWAGARGRQGEGAGAARFLHSDGD
jgi:DNA-binding beta-propeller fold protein YncE